MSDTPIIVWIRIGDLRTHDNPALFYAAQTNQSVLVVYIHDDVYVGPSQAKGATLAWLEKSLELFSQKIMSLGFGWCLKRGNPHDIIQQIIQKTRASTIMWNKRYEPDHITLDRKIEESLTRQQINVHTHHGNTLIEPAQILNKSGKPYQVFTQFWNTITRIEPNTHEIPLKTPQKPYQGILLESISVTELELTPKQLDWPKQVMSHWNVGEKAALYKLDTFLEEKIAQYDTGRDIPKTNGTSGLSPYLHFGELSIKTIWNKIVQKKSLSQFVFQNSGRVIYLKELVWREFANYLLYHFPFTATRPLRKQFEHFPFRESSLEFSRWTQGKTGVPIIDAGMRQLWQTGWMHNRVRMIVGSYLVKHLLHNWQEGASWFSETLVDADLASNTLGWQWVSGCGADAAPYFRIFNPVLQGKKFDPQGEYVKKYLPELRHIPNTYIHEPWVISANDLRSWNVELGKSYPYPLVDLQEGRKRALEAFQNI